MESFFCIKDIEDFADNLRKEVAISICDNHTENIDNFITIDQTKQFISENNLGYDLTNCILTENIYDKIVEQIQTRIYNSGLSKLAALDKIECCWDDETNEMVFWSKDKI